MKTLVSNNLDRDHPARQAEEYGEQHFGPDPLLCRKKGLGDTLPRDIPEYKSKVENESYMNHAIDRIALELMHFLVK